jgi:hypothetical protein
MRRPLILPECSPSGLDSEKRIWRPAFASRQQQLIEKASGLVPDAESKRQRDRSASHED